MGVNAAYKPPAVTCSVFKLPTCITVRTCGTTPAAKMVTEAVRAAIDGLVWAEIVIESLPLKEAGFTESQFASEVAVHVTFALIATLAALSEVGKLTM